MNRSGDTWIRNIILRPLLRWRVIVIAAIVMAVATPICKYRNDVSRSVAPIHNENEDYENDERIIYLADMIKYRDYIKEQLSKIESSEIDPTMEGNNSEVEKNRGDLYSVLNSVNSRIYDISSNFTEGQLSAADKMAKGESVVAEPKEQKPANVSINPGYIVLGAFSGAFITWMLFCVLYLISNKLHSEEEITENVGMLFGVYDIPVRKRLFSVIDDAILYRLRKNKCGFDTDRQIRDIVTSISLFGTKKEIKDICLSSSRLLGLSSEELLRSVADSIASELEKEGIGVCVVNNISYDKDALKTSSETDGLVVIEQIGSSILSEIDKEICTAKKYDVPILGTVVIE